MNARERFAVTCKFNITDRVPIDYLADFETDSNLREYLGCISEDALLDYLHCDFYHMPCRDISQNEGFMRCYRGPSLDITECERTCSLGIRWHRRAYEHKFSVDETIAGPLENAETEEDILRHPWPKAEHFDFSVLEEECNAHSNRTIIGGLWTGIMGDSYRLYGYQRFLMNLALKPKIIKALIQQVKDMYLELNDAFFSQLKDKFDIWFFGNDFGSQNGLLISADMWHEFFYDPIRELTSLAHSYGLKVMMHSCGAIAEIIPSLIDAGVDILDPIQTTAKDMDPEKLAKDFGGQIVFHGGIDTQQILPYGTSEEVEAHVSGIIRELGSKGGYIFAPSQILGPDIPMENIVAMYKRALGA